MPTPKPPNPSPSKKPISTPARKRELSPAQRRDLLATLQSRFEKNRTRHPDLAWSAVQARLEAHPEKLASLHEMERTGGEPDVVGRDPKTSEYIFYDCAPQTPKGRTGICYDRAGQQAREKEGLHPAGNVIDLAAAMGIEPLTEEQYQALQQLGEFDTKTQSWLQTPAEVRSLGGALFADRRFGRVFISANTAPCFYQGRAFRGSLRV